MLTITRNCVRAALLIGMGLLSCQSHAIWFEASGQAIVANGNKEVARHRATREAIKQALLFAGASVTSVHSLADGLLKDDRFEVRARGEVNRIELIDEQYNNGYVTVAIRADIFPQDNQCRAADYKKTLVTSHFSLRHRGQATVGGLFGVGQALAEVLREEFRSDARFVDVEEVQPHALNATQFEQTDRSIILGQQTGAQFILVSEITDLSLQPGSNSKLKFWQANYPERSLSLYSQLISTTTGEVLLEKTQSIQAPWTFKIQQPVDPNSHQFWQSDFGVATKHLLGELTVAVDERLSCLPSYGRIVHVNDGRLSINLGEKQGVKAGDELSIFQMSQFYDPLGHLHHQYQIHPVRVQVTQVYYDSAVVEPIDDVLLANIQPNDFVARL